MDEYLYFNERANYDTFSVDGKRVILYEDHRSLLNVLFFAKDRKLISSPPNIVTFDYHDDALSLSQENLSKLLDFRSQYPKLREFWNYVEFELRSNDDDWIAVGCEFGLINHVINIGSEVNHNVTLLNGHYVDSNDFTHELHLLSHLDQELGERGALCDFSNQSQENRRIRELLQFNLSNDLDFTESEVYPFILDFDLDCFSLSCLNRQIAWPEKLFVEKYVNNSRFCRYSPFHFIRKLIQRCEVITICREPNCCGGIGESNKILSYLDKYFFYNRLGTEPYS